MYWNKEKDAYLLTSRKAKIPIKKIAEEFEKTYKAIEKRIYKLRKIGLKRWRIKFSPKFKFFMNKKEVKKFEDETFNRMDQFFKKEVDDQIKEISSQVNSK